MFSLAAAQERAEPAGFLPHNVNFTRLTHTHKHTQTQTQRVPVAAPATVTAPIHHSFPFHTSIVCDGV